MVNKDRFLNFDLMRIQCFIMTETVYMKRSIYTTTMKRILIIWESFLFLVVFFPQISLTLHLGYPLTITKIKYAQKHNVFPSFIDFLNYIFIW